MAYNHQKEELKWKSKKSLGKILWNSCYSPGFTGDGWKCAKQLVNAHPDKFKISSTPAVGAIFSCIGRNHVGIVIGWDGTNITIQEGNLDGKTNSFAEAKKDWHTVTYTLSQFVSICHGVEFAIPI